MKSVKKFMKSTRKVSSVTPRINVQTASFKEMDEEHRRLRVELDKVSHKYHKAKQANRKAKTKAFDDIWNKMDIGTMTDEEWDIAWHRVTDDNSEEFYQKSVAIDKEYDNKEDVFRIQMRPIDDAIMTRFIKPELSASRDEERRDAIPLTEFRNMVESGSHGVTLELRPDQRLVTDLDDSQIDILQSQVEMGDIMEYFIARYGYTGDEEEKYGRYLDWSYPEQYDTIGGQGILPEMDFWMHINQATWDIQSERKKKKTIDSQEQN